MNSKLTFQIPRMPAVRENVNSDRVYKVDVYTGHEVDSGTNANVSKTRKIFHFKILTIALH